MTPSGHSESGPTLYRKTARWIVRCATEWESQGGPDIAQVDLSVGDNGIVDGFTLKGLGRASDQRREFDEDGNRV